MAELSAYHQRVRAQDRAWVQGVPYHNTIDDECCPDFSCCVEGMFTEDRAKRVQRFNHYADRYGWERWEDS